MVLRELDFYVISASFRPSWRSNTGNRIGPGIRELSGALIAEALFCFHPRPGRSLFFLLVS